MPRVAHAFVQRKFEHFLAIKLNVHIAVTKDRDYTRSRGSLSKNGDRNLREDEEKSKAMIKSVKSSTGN